MSLTTIVQMPPQWQIRLKMLTESYDELYGDEFRSWAHEIDLMHRRHVQCIDDRYKRAISEDMQGADSDEWSPEEFASEQMAEIESLVNKMYGALVVALWSRTEVTLVTLADISIIATGSSVKRDKRKTHIDELIRVFNKTLRCHIKRNCQSYSYMNSTRILANAFKHHDGRCNKSTRTAVDRTLASTIGLSIGERIAYHKLNISELVDKCTETVVWVKNEIANATKHQTTP